MSYYPDGFVYPCRCYEHNWQDLTECPECQKELQKEELTHDIEVIEEDLIACINQLDCNELTAECKNFFEKIYTVINET